MCLCDRALTPFLVVSLDILTARMISAVSVLVTVVSYLCYPTKLQLLLSEADQLDNKVVWIYRISNANFYSPPGELIRQNVTKQNYFAPREAWNWHKIALENGELKYRFRKDKHQPLVLKEPSYWAYGKISVLGRT